MSADPDDFRCTPSTELPPQGVPLALYAQSASNYAEWLPGFYDGRYWRVKERPQGQWYVRGWRLLDGPPGVVDCRTLLGPLSPNVPPPIYHEAIDPWG